MRAAAATSSVLAVSAAVLATSAARATDAQSEVRAQVHSYAACLAKVQPRGARRFALGETKVPPISPDCVKSPPFEVLSLRFPGDHYRYALAEALLPVEFPAGVPATVTTAAPLDHGERPTPEDQLSEKARANKRLAEERAKATGFWAIGIVGECIARAEPAKSFALITTKEDSAEETTVFGALRPAIGECLPPGATVRFQRPAIRGTIALNLYRLAHAPSAPAPPTNKTSGLRPRAGDMHHA